MVASLKGVVVSVYKDNASHKNIKSVYSKTFFVYVLESLHILRLTEGDKIMGKTNNDWETCWTEVKHMR